MTSGWLTQVGALIVGVIGGGGGLWTYLSGKDKSKSEAPQQIVSSASDLQHAVNEAAANIIKDLRGEITVLREQVETLRSEVDHLKQKWPSGYPLPSPPQQRRKAQ